MVVGVVSMWLSAIEAEVATSMLKALQPLRTRFAS
jgi:hypothetical protein